MKLKFTARKQRAADLAATVLTGDKCEIHNCPALSDVDAAIQILRHLGCKVMRDGHTVEVDSSVITISEIPDDLMREMRSSIVFWVLCSHARAKRKYLRREAVK